MVGLFARLRRSSRTASDAMTTQVMSWQGHYVVVEGVEYESDDLPDEGTDVEVSTYTGIDDNRYADVTWSADTPSGITFCTARER